MRIKNKRGWIKLVEAFISILLAGIILSLIVSQQGIQGDKASSIISNYEIYILRNIELNETLRNEILGLSESALPANWSSGFPDNTKNKIISLTPSYLSCQANICMTNDLCNFEGEKTADIYAQKIFISSTHSDYNPRQLKLFCRTV